MRFLRKYIVLIFPLLCVACNSVPDYVIPPSEMSSIMADIHVGEAVIESNYSDYPSDSAKMLLKQSILKKHGYTTTDLDTSFMWYGANLTVYGKVYDETIEILSDRLARLGDMSHNGPGAALGDSVDLWDRGRFYIIHRTSPSNFISYAYSADDGWGKGDIFTIRAKFSNVENVPNWTMTAYYDDETFEVMTGRISNAGWNELTFYTDSLKTTKKITGDLYLPSGRVPLVVDSLMIYKKPLSASDYPQRYRQRLYDLKRFRADFREDEESSEE